LPDGVLDHRRRGVKIRITDAEDDHILTTLARRHRLVVGEPRGGAITADAIDKGRELHALTVRVRC
jgi:hypothetical protein